MTATSPPGSVLRDDAGMRLEFVRSYAESIEDVWAVLTEPDRVARWFGEWTGDPASGSIQLVMTAEEGDTPQTVTVVTCTPPTRLDLDVPGPDGIWHLSTTLQNQDGGTALRFVQRLAEPYDASSIGPGWQFYLDRFGAVLTGAAVPSEFDDYYPALSSAYGIPS